MKTTLLWTEAARAGFARRAAGAALSASLLGLAACGGGGGGGGGSPPPPPPPPPAGNAAPSAVAKVIDLSTHEGQLFTLDASESADANNDPLTFRWVQTAGTAVAIPDPTRPVVADLRIPELTLSERATFKVTVSDGKTSSETSVNVAFTDIHQMPRFDTDLPLLATLPLNGYVRAVSHTFGFHTEEFLGISATPDGSVDIKELSHRDPNPFQLLPDAQAFESFQQPTVMVKSVAISPTNSFDPQFYALEETNGRLSAFVRADSSNQTSFDRKAAIGLTAPCAMSEPFDVMGDRRISVGQRGGGFVVLSRTTPDPDGNFTFGTYQKVGTSESFCALSEVRRPVSGGAVFNGNTSRFIEDMLAYDVDTNMVSVFKQDGGASAGTVKYEFVDKKKVNLGTTKPLRFVKSVALYYDSNTPAGLALLFADTQHVGSHKLVVVGLNADREIVQESSGWNVGVPVDIVNFYEPTTTSVNLVVVTETSPEALVFSPNSASGMSTDILPLAGPRFFEIGLGATVAAQTYTETASDDAMHFVVMDNQKKEARIFGPVTF